MAKMRTDTLTGDLLEWAATQPTKPEGHVINALPIFKAKMIRNGLKAASVRKGEWPERAFWREEPGEVVAMKRHG